VIYVYYNLDASFSYDSKQGLEGLLGIADGEEQVEERGDTIAVVADGGVNKAVTFEESDRGDEDDLDDNISFVSCRCGNVGEETSPFYERSARVVKTKRFF
jgi:hypothetical protein